eukprot:765284-Hanusia_phi.AAC.1
MAAKRGQRGGLEGEGDRRTGRAGAAAAAAGPDPRGPLRRAWARSSHVLGKPRRGPPRPLPIGQKEAQGCFALTGGVGGCGRETEAQSIDPETAGEP